MVIIGEKSTFLASWSPCSPDYAYRWHWKKGVKNGRETCCHASFASSKSLPWIACKVWDRWITVSNHCGRLEEWQFSNYVSECDRWDENIVVVYLRGIETPRLISTLFLCSSWLSNNMSWLTLPYVPSRYRGTISLLWTCEMFVEILCVLCFLFLVFYISCGLYLLWLKNIPPIICTPKFDNFSWAHLDISLQNMMGSQLAMFSFVWLDHSESPAADTHTLRFCPNLVMPLGHQKGRTFWWLTRILKTQRDKKDYFMFVQCT